MITTGCGLNMKAKLSNFRLAIFKGAYAEHTEARDFREAFEAVCEVHFASGISKVHNILSGNSNTGYISGSDLCDLYCVEHLDEFEGVAKAFAAALSTGFSGVKC